MNKSEPYFAQLTPPPLDGLFGGNDSTPAEAVSVPLRATEREEMAQADATRLEHMAKRVVRPSADERLAEFVRHHPDVVTALVTVCRQMKRAGLEHWSIDAAFHVVRFQHFTSVHIQAALYGNQVPTLDNDLTAPMSRYIMARFPDLDGLFVTRRRRCELVGCKGGGVNG